MNMVFQIRLVDLGDLKEFFFPGNSCRLQAETLALSSRQNVKTIANWTLYKLG